MRGGLRLGWSRFSLYNEAPQNMPKTVIHKKWKLKLRLRQKLKLKRKLKLRLSLAKMLSVTPCRFRQYWHVWRGCVLIIHTRHHSVVNNIIGIWSGQNCSVKKYKKAKILKCCGHAIYIALLFVFGPLYPTPSVPKQLPNTQPHLAVITTHKLLTRSQYLGLVTGK